MPSFAAGINLGILSRRRCVRPTGLASQLAIYFYWHGASIRPRAWSLWRISFVLDVACLDQCQPARGLALIEASGAGALIRNAHCIGPDPDVGYWLQWHTAIQMPGIVLKTTGLARRTGLVLGPSGILPWGVAVQIAIAPGVCVADAAVTLTSREVRGHGARATHPRIWA